MDAIQPSHFDIWTRRHIDPLLFKLESRASIYYCLAWEKSCYGHLWIYYFTIIDTKSIQSLMITSVNGLKKYWFSTKRYSFFCHCIWLYKRKNPLDDNPLMGIMIKWKNHTGRYTLVIFRSDHYFPFYPFVFVYLDCSVDLIKSGEIVSCDQIGQCVTLLEKM